MSETGQNHCVSSLRLKNWMRYDRWSRNWNHRQTPIDRPRSCCFHQNYRHRDRHHLFFSLNCDLA